MSGVHVSLKTKPSDLKDLIPNLKYVGPCTETSALCTWSETLYCNFICSMASMRRTQTNPDYELILDVTTLFPKGEFLTETRVYKKKKMHLQRTCSRPVVRTIVNIVKTQQQSTVSRPYVHTTPCAFLEMSRTLCTPCCKLQGSCQQRLSCIPGIAYILWSGSLFTLVPAAPLLPTRTGSVTPCYGLPSIINLITADLTEGK